MVWAYDQLSSPVVGFCLDLSAREGGHGIANDSFDADHDDDQNALAFVYAGDLVEDRYSHAEFVVVLVGEKKGDLVHDSTVVVLKEDYIEVEAAVLGRLLVEARVLPSEAVHMQEVRYEEAAVEGQEGDTVGDTAELVHRERVEGTMNHMEAETHMVEDMLSHGLAAVAVVTD